MNKFTYHVYKSDDQVLEPVMYVNWNPVERGTAIRKHYNHSTKIFLICYDLLNINTINVVIPQGPLLSIFYKQQ